MDISRFDADPFSLRPLYADLHCSRKVRGSPPDETAEFSEVRALKLPHMQAMKNRLGHASSNRALLDMQPFDPQRKLVYRGTPSAITPHGIRTNTESNLMTRTKEFHSTQCVPARSSWISRERCNEQGISRPVPNTPTGIASALRTALLFLAGAAAAACTTATPEIQAPQDHDGTTVTLYFSDFQAQHVLPETRTLESPASSNALLHEIVEALLAGPQAPYSAGIFPQTTRVLSATLDDGTARVDFSADVTRMAGSAAEMMAVRSLVYSLTDLPRVQRVQILIAGGTTQTLGGHLSIDEPFTRERLLYASVPIFIDERRASWLQERVAAGDEEALLHTDPLAAARWEARMVGFTGEDAFALSTVDSVAGMALVHVTRPNGDRYALTLIQPAERGRQGVWMLQGTQPL